MAAVPFGTYPYCTSLAQFSVSLFLYSDLSEVSAEIAGKSGAAGVVAASVRPTVGDRAGGGTIRDDGSLVVGFSRLFLVCFDFRQRITRLPIGKTVLVLGKPLLDLDRV